MAYDTGLKPSSEYKKELEELRKQMSSLETEIRVKTELIKTPNIGEELLTLTKQELSIAEYALTGAKQKQQELEFFIKAAEESEAGGTPPDKGETEQPEIPVEPDKGEGNTGKPETGGDKEEEKEDCNCPEKEEGSGGEVSNEVKPDMVVPQLNMRGVFTYKPPFDKVEYKDLEVTVKALRLIKEVVDSEDDPWVNIYQLNGLSEDIFARDTKWKVPIIVFATDENKYFYVPATYLGSLPKPQTGVKYQQFILGVDLGYLPVEYNLDLAKNTILENLKAVTGIASRIETIEASAIEIVQQEQHEQFQKLMKERLTDTSSPAVKLRNLQEKFVQLQEQLKIYNNCFHHHVEKGLELFSEEMKKRLEEEAKEEANPDADPKKFTRTELEYQKVLGDYYTAKFGYDSFLARYQELKNRYDALEVKRKELEDTIDAKDQEIGEIKVARDEEFRKRDRYYKEKHIFEKHWYVEADDKSRMYGVVQINTQNKNKLNASDKNDTYGYVLGEYPVLCADCIKHTYEYIDLINTATLEAIPTGQTSISVNIDNSGRTKSQTMTNPTTGKSETTQVPDPLPIKIETGWDYGIKIVQSDTEVGTRSDYVQPGQTGYLNYVWFGTTKKEKLQYCKHITSKFWNKDIKFDPYAVAAKPTNITTDGRELTGWVFDLDRDIKVSATLKSDIDRICNKIADILKTNLARTPLKVESNEYVMTTTKKVTIPKERMEVQDPSWKKDPNKPNEEPATIFVDVPEREYSYEEKTNYTQWDSIFCGTGNAPRGDGDRVNTFARTMISATRLNNWVKNNLEPIAQASAKKYNLTEVTWINVLTYLQNMLSSIMDDYITSFKQKNINIDVNNNAYYPDKAVWPTVYQNPKGYDAVLYQQTAAYWNITVLHNIIFPVATKAVQDLNTFVDTTISTQVNACWTAP